MPQSTSLIDLDALPAEVRWRVEWALNDALREYDRAAWAKGVCENGTDAEVIAAGEREYPSAPIGLSTWYERVWNVQETVFAPASQSRRPVFMKGAKNVLIRAHCLTAGGDSPNGWAVKVFWRAVRMARITALTRDEFKDATYAIYRKLHAKYYLTGPFDRNTGWDVWGGPILIGGQRSYLEGEQLRHVRALSSIAKKAETLDKKREMVRRQLMERLAA